jgi:hypothetical protein
LKNGLALLPALFIFLIFGGIVYSIIKAAKQ